MVRIQIHKHEMAVQLEKPKLDKPPLYHVFLLNDDYTSMGFVIEVLEKIFYLSHEKAVHLMFQIHTTGKAIVAVYTREVAEMRVKQVNEYARLHDYPLQCGMEPA